MLNIRLAPAAEQDIEEILVWTHQRVGESIRLRYEALLVQALLDLAEDPKRAGVIVRKEIGRGVHSYHLRFSRVHVETATGRIRKPRHLLLFRAMAEGVLEVGRVLHDNMELSQHLPPGYPSDVPDDSDP